MDNIIDFYDIYDYYTIPFWQTTWFMVCIGLLIVTIGVLCFFILRKKTTQLPWQWAEQEVNRLSQMTLTHKNDYKKFYFTLTTIIKGYLNKQYDWKLDDKTDEELNEWLTQQKFNPEITEMLKKIADGALWIKFANADALKSQADADITKVLLMIEKTKTPSQAPR